MEKSDEPLDVRFCVSVGFLRAVVLQGAWTRRFSHEKEEEKKKKKSEKRRTPRPLTPTDKTKKAKDIHTLRALYFWKGPWRRGG